jgi:ribosomal protein L11 methyltransferase
MNYIELTCEITPYTELASELLIAELGEIGFESFTVEGSVVNAYIQHQLFDIEKVKSLNIINDNNFCDIKYSHKVIEDQNWNAKWEENFDPIIIDDRCIIKAPFHNITKSYEYEITIMPKMSFGTGHHETTSLIVNKLLDVDVTDKIVLDMGCGTGILAILASMKGAKAITAIDNDEWAYNNSVENIATNNTENIDVHLGDAEMLKGLSFDIIIANINRNILLNDMEAYFNSLNNNGHLIMSGFYLSDLETIKDKAHSLGLKFKSYSENNNWVEAEFIK